MKLYLKHFLSVWPQVTKWIGLIALCLFVCIVCFSYMPAQIPDTGFSSAAEAAQFETISQSQTGWQYFVGPILGIAGMFLLFGSVEKISDLMSRSRRYATLSALILNAPITIINAETIQPTPNTILMSELKRVASDTTTHNKAQENFITTFDRLGMGSKAEDLSLLLLSTIRDTDTIEEAERKIRSCFEQTGATNGRTVFELIQGGLDGRFELMFSQLQPHLKGVRHAIDYGCGSGVLTQMLHDRLGMKMEGVDVRDFRAKKVTVPVRQFDGYQVPVADGHYQCAVLTNVIHHEVKNERLLAELDRIAANKLVIIETVPEAVTDEEAKADWGRMLLNDALWNRFFNYANIPCPGTYETPTGWIRRIEQYGWQLVHSQDLGFDQPTIQDRHHLLVFER